VDGDELARLDITHELSADDVQGRGFAGDDPTVGKLADAERAHAVWVAYRVQALAVRKSQAVCALDAREKLERGFLHRGVLVDEVRDEGAHDVRVARLISGIHEALFRGLGHQLQVDRKSTRLNSSH